MKRSYMRDKISKRKSSIHKNYIYNVNMSNINISEQKYINERMKRHIEY